MKAKKLFFKECHLAGRQYHDVDEVWEELHVGTLLELARDLDNRYDKNAVAVIYNQGLDEDTGERDDYICLATSLLMRMKRLHNCLKWVGTMSSSAVSRRSILMLIMRIRFV